jgi:hypothetical protein
MMAKMFYTMDETKAALGKNEEEIKQLAREGRLREFRDGARLMFKADQVESLRGELGGDAVDLGRADSVGALSLADSRGGSGSGISLADTRGSGQKDDTAIADLGLSGTGIPSPGRSGSGSRAGINVLGDSESPGDPSAQTSLSASGSDQVNLEGVGSGSGLLDLTREKDDTSLGAELLDEISPGGSGTARVPGGSGSGTGVAVASSAGMAGRRIGAPMYIEAADAMAPAMGGMALGASLFALLGVIAVFSGAMGTKPELLGRFSDMSFLVLAGIGAGLAFVGFIIGMIVGKAVK